MKKNILALIALLIYGVSASAQNHQTVIYDSTSVFMKESGLSHVIRHQRIHMEDYIGCRDNGVIKIDYDPQSAYVEFRQVILHHSNGDDEDLLTGRSVYDYVAPARMIYWGASQKMVEVGHLDPGDEIEFTTYRKGFTYALLADDDSRYIPPMRGHFYDIVPFWSDCPVAEKVYSVNILNTKTLQYKIYNDLFPGSDIAITVTIKKEVQDDRTIYTFTKQNITPLKHETSSLADNDIQCKLLLSTSPNWEAKSVWFYNVNEDYGSFVATQEVRDIVAELLRNAKDENDSISILTHWVADNIRYAGVSMGEGEGFTLHNAEMNFADRCGVCKDKAGALITMLRAAGFEAYAAMTMAHERIDRIPADQFNHSVCAVRHRDGRFEMLDPTWVPNVRELWSSAEQQQGYLIGLPQGADLMYTPISAPENHYLRILGNSTIDEEGNLSGTLTIEAEGQSDASVRGIFRAPMSLWRSNLERELLAIASNAEITDIEYTDNDRYLDQPVKITYHYRVPHYAIIGKDDIAFIPISARGIFSRAMGHLTIDTRAENRTQPFQSWYSQLIEINETIKLPKEYKQLHFPTIEGVAHPAASFGCQYWMEGDTLTFGESVIIGKRIFEAQDWPMFRQTVINQRKLASTPVILN